MSPKHVMTASVALQQAVPAGEQLRFIAKLLQHTQRLGKRLRRVIFELARNHRSILFIARSTPGIVPVCHAQVGAHG